MRGGCGELEGGGVRGVRADLPRPLPSSSSCPSDTGLGRARRGTSSCLRAAPASSPGPLRATHQ